MHGSRYIYMPSIVTSVLEFSTRHDAVLLFDIFKMGIGHGSGHLNALIYHIQGQPLGIDIMYLVLADRNMQVRFGLKVVWEF